MSVDERDDLKAGAAQDIRMPFAQIQFARGIPGRENEMPQVVSCNWLPDGIYSVYLQPPVVISPLEWVDDSDERERWRARPPIGPYYTIEDDGFSSSKYLVSAHQLVIGNFDELDMAIASAQADYEARIRAALSPVGQAPQTWPTEAVCRIIHDNAGAKDPDEPLHHPAQKSWEEPLLKQWQQWEGLSDELRELINGRTCADTAPDNRHEFVPHKKHPWFCAHCGYAPHLAADLRPVPSEASNA